MSTIAYGLLSRQRAARDPGQPPRPRALTAERPSAAGYVATAAALVPAEVLAAHAVLISYSTATSEDGRTVTVTHPDTAAFLFWALLALTVFLYVGSRGWRLRGRGDYARAAIPPLAFVTWTMLQHATAFDGVVRRIDDATRFTVAVLAAIVLGFFAAKLGIPDAD